MPPSALLQLGREKQSLFPAACWTCDVFFANVENVPSAVSKRFFRHVDGPMRTLAKLFKEE